MDRLTRVQEPLPPIIDDPEWDMETFAEQEQRLADRLAVPETTDL